MVIKKASFFSSTGENLTKDSEENALGKAGFEVSAKGEAKFSTELKAGLDSTGMYIQASAGFDGLNAYFTANARIKKRTYGFKNKIYPVMDAEPNILKSDKHYIVKKHEK